MQKAKGIRLWLEARRGRKPVYVIRDGARKISTGCPGDDLEGAHQALASYLAQTFSPNTRERDLSRISCAEVLMLYARDIAPSRAGAATIGYHLKALDPFWSGKTLADVKGSTCRDYVTSRPVKPATARLELKTLQAAINHWQRESPLPAVPRVTLPPPGVPRERFLERKEVAAMLRASRKLKLPHVARFILIGLYTGTRHAAILGLKWLPSSVGGHVDLERHILYRRGFAERETSKRRPAAQIPRRLLHFLRHWKEHDADHDVAHLVSYGGLRVAKMKRAWASVVKEAGLGKDVTPHVLRHTFITWKLWEGHSVWDVAGMAGASPTMIERVYGHHKPVTPQRKTA